MEKTDRENESLKPSNTMVLSTLSKTWIFDLDGTLLYTLEDLKNSI